VHRLELSPQLLQSVAVVVQQLGQLLLLLQVLAVVGNNNHIVTVKLANPRNLLFLFPLLRSFRHPLSFKLKESSEQLSFLCFGEELNTVRSTFSLRSLAFLLSSFICCALYSLSYLFELASLTLWDILRCYVLRCTFFTIYYSNSSSILEYSSCKIYSFSCNSLILFLFVLLEDGLKNELLVSLTIDTFKGLITQLEARLMMLLDIEASFSDFDMSWSLSREIGRVVSSLLTY